MTPLGIRQNNPCNIRITCPPSRWKGLVSSPNGFCAFKSMPYGIRAFLVLMRTYVTKHNVKTVRQFVHRFCPNGDGNNNEIKYCAAILSFLREVYDFDVSLDTPFLDVVFSKPRASSELAIGFTSAVCHVESGYVLRYAVFESAVTMI